MSLVALLNRSKNEEGLDLYYGIAPQGHRTCTFVCMRTVALGRGTNRYFPLKLLYGVPHLGLDLSLSRTLKFESSKPIGA